MSLGQVHTIPFSAVGPVSNLTREYAYYVIDMGVAYRENYDEVVAVMREVSEELRQDPEFGPDVVEPLEVMGLQSFEDSAVVIRARLKTAPSRQWSTGASTRPRQRISRKAHERFQVPKNFSTRARTQWIARLRSVIQR